MKSLPRESLGLLLIGILEIIRRIPRPLTETLAGLCLPLYLIARRNHVRQIAARWECMPDAPPFRAGVYYRRRWRLFMQALKEHGGPHLPQGITVEGREYLVKALDSGKPLLIAGIHLGPFEWLHKAPYRDILTANRNYRVVTAPAFSRLLNQYVARGRTAPGKEIVFNRSLLQAVKQTLKEGDVLACMMDQNPDRENNSVLCWDRLQVPAAHKLLELFIRQGGIVLPITAYRGTSNKGRVICHSPLNGRANTTDGCRQWLSRWLEDQIKEHPWEYNWSYPGLHRKQKRD